MYVKELLRERYVHGHKRARNFSTPVFFTKLETIGQSFCKDSNHYMCMAQLENNLAFWLVLTENKIPSTVKISIYFLSPIAFGTYQNQYRSKYSIRFTQRFIKGKNFEFSAISFIRYLELFCWSCGISR